METKVWAVCYGDYDENQVWAIFDSQELANEYAKQIHLKHGSAHKQFGNDDEPTVEEFILNKPALE